VSIAEYKKRANNTKIIELEFFKVKIRKLKPKDYIGVSGLPSIYSLEEKEQKDDPPQEDALQLFNTMKKFICACVVPDKDNDMPGIVDRPESECKDWEISFEETLSDEDAFKLFNTIQEFTVGGGQSDMAVFREEQDVPDSGDDDGQGIRKVSA